MPGGHPRYHRVRPLPARFYLVMSCSITSGAGISHAVGFLLVAAFLLGESLAAIVIASSARRLASRKAIKAIVVASAILLAAPEITVLLPMRRSRSSRHGSCRDSGRSCCSPFGAFSCPARPSAGVRLYFGLCAVAVSVLGFTRICLKPYMISVGGLLIVLASLGLPRVGPFPPARPGASPFPRIRGRPTGAHCSILPGRWSRTVSCSGSGLRAFYLGVFRAVAVIGGRSRGPYSKSSMSARASVTRLIRSSR